jgi:hypothetical protein
MCVWCVLQEISLWGIGGGQPSVQRGGQHQQLLYRGLRLKAGMHMGRMDATLSPVSGCLVYRGRVAMLASRISSNARAGQVSYVPYVDCRDCVRFALGCAFRAGELCTVCRLQGLPYVCVRFGPTCLMCCLVYYAQNACAVPHSLCLYHIFVLYHISLPNPVK